MDVKDLRYFVAVYEARSFSKATNVLGTVPSNVSLRIRNLEQFLDVMLFERRQRGVAPTAKGERLYAHAKQVISVLEKTEQDIRTAPQAP